MISHKIIVFYSQLDNEKYILEYKNEYKEQFLEYMRNQCIDITVHTLVDNDVTINTILSTNPYFSEASMLRDFEQLKNKVEEIITKKVPSLFDEFLNNHL